jgi:hypothetical protein
MQFELMRLSMVERPQLDAFVRVSEDGSSFTRERWLRDVFSRPIQFEHRKDIFHYVPEEDNPSGEGAIFGRIGRKIKISENEPPEKKFVETERDAWRAALIIIDPSHHKDGQKVAVERAVNIGHPIPIFESLAVKISTQDEPFVLEVNAIVPQERFWEFVASNKGQITSVQFEFIVPNMFGEADDYDREMREMREQEKAQKAKLSIESKDGLDLNTDKVKRAADYTTKGAGSIKARTKTGKTYSSKDKAQRESIPSSELDEQPEESLLSHIFSRIFRL